MCFFFIFWCGHCGPTDWQMNHQIERWTKPHVVTSSQIKTKMSSLILISILHSRSYERVLKSLNVVTKEILSLFSIGSSAHEIVALLLVCLSIRSSEHPPQLWGSNPSLEAQIPALRLKSQPRGWDLGLETGIWASRLGFEGEGMEEEEEEEKEKIPHMCESIGHRPLCPKTRPDTRLPMLHVGGQGQYWIG